MVLACHEWQGRGFCFWFVVELKDGKKLCIAESDVESYPGMFVRNANQSNSLKGVFAPYPKEKIQILFAEQKQTVKADSKGYWEVNLKALETGGPYQLQIIGKENPISIKDILIGDVWLCSGQSNMQWVVNNVTNAEVEKKNANYPQIRTLNIPRRMELSPKDTISATWLVCSPENVGRFSGVAYFFAKKVYE